MFYMSEYHLNMIREISTMGGEMIRQIKKEKQMKKELSDFEVLDKIIRSMCVDRIEDGIPTTTIGGEDFYVLSGLWSKDERLKQFFDEILGYSEEVDLFDMFRVRGFVLTHKFAEYLWGTEPFNGFRTHFHNSIRISYKPLYEMCEDPEKAKKNDAQWKAHLQQMVLYENPIDYLRNFV